jgi:hypothetical protein
MRELVESMTPEEREVVWPARELWNKMLPKERLQGLSPEERLQGLSPEERLQGLSPEELLQALSPDELERLRQLLRSQTQADDSSHSE